MLKPSGRNFFSWIARIRPFDVCACILKEEPEESYYLIT